MKSGDYEIPFRDGNQLDYPSYGVTWEQNYEFEDALMYKTYVRGRSAAHMIMQRKSNGKTVVVFLTDLSDMIPRMVNGEITGIFTFTKRGQNYGCKFLMERASEIPFG